MLTREERWGVRKGTVVLGVEGGMSIGKPGEFEVPLVDVWSLKGGGMLAE